MQEQVAPVDHRQVLEVTKVHDEVFIHELDTEGRMCSLQDAVQLFVSQSRTG